MQKAIHQTWFFERTPIEVWAYLTDAALLEQWLMKNDFKPEVGHKFSFQSIRGKDCETGGISYCEVQEVTPYSRLSYSWRTQALGDGQYYDSMVTWTLSPTAKGTKLELLHDGFVAAADRDGHDHGWSLFGTKFVELLNTKANDHVHA
ncbi:MAG: SRPBCC domain-containing protein [Bacteroidetes bacterium]|nr:SRPBCC domain-containing protein [Bacteroidota bacterium]